MSAPVGEQQQAPTTGITGQQATPPVVMFSQADVDRIVGDRLARETRKYANYDELVAAKTELDTMKAANATDLEKAIQKARDEAGAEIRATTDRQLIAAEIRALAAAARFHDPKVAPALADLTGIKVGADGTVDTAAAEAAVKALADAHPYLVASEEKKDPKTPRRDPAQGARPGEKPDGRDAGRAEAERRFGKKTT